MASEQCGELLDRNQHLLFLKHLPWQSVRKDIDFTQLTSSTTSDVYANREEIGFSNGCLEL